MKIRATNPVQALTPGLVEHLARLRVARNFQPGPWVQAKMSCLNHYFAQARLCGAVVGVSGGIDSSLVAALLHRASRQPGSPIKHIALLAMPAHDDPGVTGQADATNRARILATHLGLALHEIDVAPAALANRRRISSSMQIQDTPWASGQGIAIARTQALYQAASLASSIDRPSLVVGTTNRDEGAWLGYVGKASDGMVDLQPISDLHKSEVLAVARHLGYKPLYDLQATDKVTWKKVYDMVDAGDWGGDASHEITRQRPPPCTRPAIALNTAKASANSEFWSFTATRERSRSPLENTICSPERLRMRVDLRPMCSTVPSTS